MLRDRAAAARKAFNRADALVELAQGYLRGDRPDRSPIEVMLTVPASVLCDEVADPVEVGELGESFLSRAAARRLSCDAGVVEILEDSARPRRPSWTRSDSRCRYRSGPGGSAGDQRYYDGLRGAVPIA
jgi:hypothetical protein